MPPHEIPEDPFHRKTSTRIMLRAVEDLCRVTGQSLEEMEQLTPTQIGEVALSAYGDDLPEFWRIWADWQGPDQIQPMGDL